MISKRCQSYSFVGQKNKKSIYIRSKSRQVHMFIFLTSYEYYFKLNYSLKPMPKTLNNKG